MYKYLIIIIVVIVIIILLKYLIGNKKELIDNKEIEKEIIKKNMIKKIVKITKIFNSNVEYYSRIAHNNFSNIMIYYINCKNCKSRNIQILKEFNKYKLKNIKRIDCNHYSTAKLKLSKKLIEYSNNNVKYIFKNYLTITKPSPQIGEISCLTSHLKAIREGFKNNLNKVLIVEDDISLICSPFWKYSLKEIINKVPDDWEIIKLYCNKCIKHKFKKYFLNSYGTVAYIINKKGMLKINKYFLNSKLFKINMENKINIQADYFLYTLCKTYVYMPLFITNNLKIDSLIHTEYTIQHYKDANRILSKYIKNIKNKKNKKKKNLLIN